MKNILYKNLNNAKEVFNSNFKNKAGVYQLVNLINNKIYVGSSADLNRRLNEYLNPLYIARNLAKGNSRVMNALLKYGYSNFGIKVLEVIEFDSNVSKTNRRDQILDREQHYMDLFKPDYNLNKIAGSNLGRVYSQDVRTKMSLAKLGKPGNKKGTILSAEVKALMRENSGIAKKIVMLNDKNEILNTFNSIQIASEATGISRNRISRCARGIRSQIIEKGIIYIFKYV